LNSIERHEHLDHRNNLVGGSKTLQGYSCQKRHRCNFSTSLAEAVVMMMMMMMMMMMI
jgi:hypothetical protein